MAERPRGGGGRGFESLLGGLFDNLDHLSIISLVVERLTDIQVVEVQFLDDGPSLSIPLKTRGCL